MATQRFEPFRLPTRAEAHVCIGPASDPLQVWALHARRQVERPPHVRARLVVCPAPMAHVGRGHPPADEGRAEHMTQAGRLRALAHLHDGLPVGGQRPRQLVPHTMRMVAYSAITDETSRRRAMARMSSTTIEALEISPRCQ